MPKKRGHNEGSIYQQANGKWRAQITLDGKRLSYTAKTRKECLEWIQKTQTQIRKGLSYTSAQTTFGEFLEHWLLNKETHLRTQTMEQYRRTAKNHILPTLAHVKFKDLTPSRIQRLYNTLLDDGVGPRTVQIVHAVIHGCLEQAFKISLVTFNPSSVVIVPKVEEKEMKVWNEAQVSQFLVTIKAQRNEHLYRLALATGMRQAELLGLMWDDIDWSGMLSVRRQVFSPDGGGYTFVPPKTKFGVRNIELGAQVIESLRDQQSRVDEWRAFFHKSWQENKLVFPSTRGTPLGRYNLLIEFKEYTKQAGLPQIRFHDMRHIAASLMLNHGIPVIIVSRILGHSKPSVTLDLYGHLMPGMQTEAAQLMDSLVHPVEIEL